MYPILWQIGSISIYSYGVMVAIGIMVSTYLCQFHAAKRGIEDEKIVDLIFWVIIFGLIGGRLLYVLLNLNDFVSQPLEIVKIYKGGLIFHGSFIAGIITAFAFIKKTKMPLGKSLDLIAVYAPLGHAFGRIGCFLNGCCYGHSTDVSWGVLFPGHMYHVHPTQIYSTVLLFGLCVFLYFRERKKLFDGQIISLYFILYGVMRFTMEFLRGDNPAVLGGLSVFQIISIGLLIVGIIMYRNFKTKGVKS
ncbi:MAG: prolipoprotein diacylglyceryl transferase [PVC group bacterium]|nr:prolipoprotein diacylglyceryl transferase [PVC group bacterium]